MVESVWYKTKAHLCPWHSGSKKVATMMEKLPCKNTSVHLIDDILYVSVNHKLIIMYNYKDNSLLVDTSFENKNKLYQAVLVFGCSDKLFQDMMLEYRKAKKEAKLCK
jgi:hypothetical protein